jgi:hypothetical protein
MTGQPRLDSALVPRPDLVEITRDSQQIKTILQAHHDRVVRTDEWLKNIGKPAIMAVPEGEDRQGLLGVSTLMERIIAAHDPEWRLASNSWDFPPMAVSDGLSWIKVNGAATQVVGTLTAAVDDALHVTRPGGNGHLRNDPPWRGEGGPAYRYFAREQRAAYSALGEFANRMDLLAHESAGAYRALLASCGWLFNTEVALLALGVVVIGRVTRALPPQLRDPAGQRRVLATREGQTLLGELLKLLPPVYAAYNGYHMAAANFDNVVTRHITRVRETISSTPFMRKWPDPLAYLPRRAQGAGGQVILDVPSIPGDRMRPVR